MLDKSTRSKQVCQLLLSLIVVSSNRETIACFKHRAATMPDFIIAIDQAIVIF